MKSSSLVWACTFSATPIAFTPVTLGRTLEDLISAVTCQDLTKVKELDGADVDVNYREGTYSNTHLMEAATGSMELFNLLLEKGGDVNARTADGNTPLNLAEKEEDQQMLALLKELVAN